MITIYRKIDGIEEVVCRVADDNVSYGDVLMGKDEITVSVTVDEPLPVKVLDYIWHENIVYTQNREPEFEKKSDVEYVYTLCFEAPKYALLDKGYTYLITDQTRFYLTGTLRDFLDLLIENIGQLDGGWSIGRCPDTARKNLYFESITCGDVLNKLAEEYSLEYNVANKRIDFYDRYEAFTPLVFEQGKGKGLYTLSQRNVDTDNTVTRAILYGGTKNIPVGYRNGSEHIRWSDPVTGKKYVENFSEYQKIVERDVYFDDVYPHFDGAVDAVRGEYNEIVKCNAIDFDINDHLVGGVTAKINFVTGDLMGVAFELTYDHANREVTLIRQEDETAPAAEDGTRPLIPNENRKPQPGDVINFTDINMPDEYVQRAEEELHAKGVEWLNYHSQLRVAFDLAVDHRYLRQNEIALHVGDVIRIVVPEKNIDRALRVIGVEKNLSTGSLTCEVSNYPKYSWQKEMEGRIAAAKHSVEVMRSEILYDVNSTKEWAYRMFARLFGGNTLIGNQIIQGDLAVKDALIRSLKGVDGNFLKLTDRELQDNVIFQLFRLFAQEVMVENYISSPDFVSGFLGGTGWAVFRKEFVNALGITETKSAAEMDEITIRGTMRVYEMIISQLLGENGTRLTADMMRVLSIDPDQNRIYMDTEEGVLYNPFRAGDVIMVQRFMGVTDPGQIIKQYEFLVESVGSDYESDPRREWLVYKNFVGDLHDVQARDVLTRVDSLTNPDRKGIIKHTSVEPNSPYIDIMYGMKTDPGNAVKTRLGKLAGIVSQWWGQLNGYGLFSDNAYLLGDFRLRTGEDVLTRFEILAGQLKSTIQKTVNSLREADNLFHNAAFADNLDGWTFENEIDVYGTDADFLGLGVDMLSDKKKLAEVIQYDGRPVLHILDSYVRQSNGFIRLSDKYTDTLYLVLDYKCNRAGTLSIGFEGTSGGYTGGLQTVQMNVQPTDGFVRYAVSGTWDGVGHFVIRCTGDVYIESLSLTTRPLDEYKKEVSTLFQQTEESILAVARSVETVSNGLNGIDKIIKEAGWITTADGNKLWASHTTVNNLSQTLVSLYSELSVLADAISSTVTKVDNIAQTIENAGWITKSSGNTLWAKKEMEKGETIISTINQTPESVKVKAKNIELTGFVSINDGFRVNEDGSLEVHTGTFWGGIKTPFKRINESDAGVVPVSGVDKFFRRYVLHNDLNVIDYGHDLIYLPSNTSYEGAHVNVLNTSDVETGAGTFVATGNGSGIRGMEVTGSASQWTDPTNISFTNGIVEFLAVATYDANGDKNGIEWFVISKNVGGISLNPGI